MKRVKRISEPSYPEAKGETKKNKKQQQTTAPTHCASANRSQLVTELHRKDDEGSEIKREGVCLQRRAEQRKCEQTHHGS